MWLEFCTAWAKLGLCEALVRLQQNFLVSAPSLGFSNEPSLARTLTTDNLSHTSTKLDLLDAGPDVSFYIL